MSAISGFVLAGGQSSRMGRNKAFLKLDGRTLLARALELVRAVATETYIVGPRDEFADFAAVIEDVYPGHGPLGGIHAALCATRTQLNLVLAVDTPFVTLAFLRHLVETAQAGTAQVTVPRAGGRFHPLCAVYRRGFREAAERALQAGRNKVDALFAEVEVRVIEEAELARLAFEAQMFDNLNSPTEWEQAQRRFQASKP